MPDVEYQLLNGLSGERVERAKRLVHQHQSRTRSKRASDAYALLHTTRELVDRPIGELVETDQAQLLHGGGSPLGGGNAAHAQAELDVLTDVEPGHQGVFLEYHAAIGARAGHGLAVELDCSMRRRQKPGDAG